VNSVAGFIVLLLTPSRCLQASATLPVRAGLRQHSCRTSMSPCTASMHSYSTQTGPPPLLAPIVSRAPLLFPPTPPRPHPASPPCPHPPSARRQLTRLASADLCLPLPASACRCLPLPASACLCLPLPASACLCLPLPAAAPAAAAALRAHCHHQAAAPATLLLYSSSPGSGLGLRLPLSACICLPLTCLCLQQRQLQPGAQLPSVPTAAGRPQIGGASNARPPRRRARLCRPAAGSKAATLLARWRRRRLVGGSDIRLGSALCLQKT
jgi:hypothetical protein